MPQPPGLSPHHCPYDYYPGVPEIRDFHFRFSGGYVMKFAGSGKRSAVSIFKFTTG